MTHDTAISEPARRQWPWALAAIAPGALLLAARLNLDLWYEEVYTLYHHAPRPFGEIATDYSAPNNHVLFSMLLRLWHVVYLVVPLDGVLRLPSLLFSVGTLSLVFSFGRRYGGLAVGVLSGWTLAATQMFLVYGIQLRGYALSMFLIVLLAHLAAARGERNPVLRRLGIVLGGAALLYTLPSNALVLAPMCVLALVIAWLRDRRVSNVIREAAWWLGPWALAALAYAPIARQVLALAGEDAEPLRIVSAVDYAFGFYRNALIDYWMLAAVLPLGLVAWWRRGAARDVPEGWVLPLVALGMMAGPFAATGIAGVAPLLPSYCGVLPFIALTAGWLLSELVAMLWRAAGRQVPLAGVVMLGGLLLGLVAAPRLESYAARLAIYRQTQAANDGYFNYYAADFEPSAVAAYLEDALRADEPYEICYHLGDHYNFLHYFMPARIPMLGLNLAPGQPRRVYYIEPLSRPRKKEPLQGNFRQQTLEALPVARSVGYYRIHRSPELMVPDAS